MGVNMIILMYEFIAASVSMGVTMYKILLVDDEEMVIKSLKATVNWEEYGFEIAGYALSTEEAIEKADKLKPDVVITDIKMPRMNGLELLQMLKAIHPQIYCVVISGHAEFAYIQKSIRLEAVGYCLKPFDADEIAVYLKRIRKNLEKPQVTDDKAYCILDYIQSSSVEALSYMYQYYKDENIDFEASSICAMYVIGIDKADLFPCLLIIHAGYKKYICLMKENEVNDFVNNMISRDYPIHIGISKPIASFEKVAKAVREAKGCAYQYFCQKDCNAVVKSIEYKKDMTLLQALERELEKNDVSRIHKIILEISDKFLNGDYNIDYAIRLQNIYATWISSHSKGDETDLIFEYEALCEEYPRVFDLLFQIEADYNRLNHNITFQNNISNKTFATIFRYIENNYLEQINITQLSEEFHINTCYFSQLFKKEMGCTFTDYLSKKRIEYASKLLLETDLKINEIAEMAGFSDYFYFSRLFRKIKNCSPTEYRTG